MKITADNRNKIETSFPKEKFLRLCKGRTGIENLQTTEIQVVFDETVKAFVAGSLATEELADIASYLYTIFLKNNKAEGPLNDALNAASELTFYMRTKETTHTLERFRNIVLDYYSQHSE